MAKSISRQAGRELFGLDPSGYDASRPEYPTWVFDELRSRCGLRAGTSVFEIGAGTGTATRRLLVEGAHPLVAIEPDPRMADFLVGNSSNSALEVKLSTFEDAQLEPAAYDLGVCATAFHWLEEDAALVKIARLLRPGGWWAAIWNVFGDDSRPDPFHEATSELLKGPTTPSAGERGIPFALDIAARTKAIEDAGVFDAAQTMKSAWSLILDADQTMALYGSYSNINVRPDRTEVLEELGRIARNEFGNRVVRNMITILYIARRGP
jgi:SAM-dependent methyltransferase